MHLNGPHTLLWSMAQSLSYPILAYLAVHHKQVHVIALRAYLLAATHRIFLQLFEVFLYFTDSLLVFAFIFPVTKQKALD